LVGAFGSLSGAGPGGDGFGVGDPVGDEGGGGAQEPGPFGRVVVEAFGALGGDDDAAVEGAESFEEGGGVAEAEGGEFVDDEQRSAIRASPRTVEA
jgi:hypothetical protein